MHLLVDFVDISAMSELQLHSSSYKFLEKHSTLKFVCLSQRPIEKMSYVHSSLSPEPRVDHVHLLGCPAHQTGLSLEQIYSHSVIIESVHQDGCLKKYLMTKKLGMYFYFLTERI